MYVFLCLLAPAQISAPIDEKKEAAAGKMLYLIQDVFFKDLYWYYLQKIYYLYIFYKDLSKFIHLYSVILRTISGNHFEQFSKHFSKILFFPSMHLH